MENNWKKTVLKLDIKDAKQKRRAIMAASSLTGVYSIVAHPTKPEMTVTGPVDPVRIVLKLRKHCPTEILTVGPAKETETDQTETETETDSDADLAADIHHQRQLVQLQPTGQSE